MVELYMCLGYSINPLFVGDKYVTPTGKWLQTKDEAPTVTI